MSRVIADGLSDKASRQYAELSGDTPANFTTMPQVGGDPIVESGSNADGQFTRWADGTQVTSQQFSLGNNLGTLTNGFFDINQSFEDFPAVFSEVPILSISVAGALSTGTSSIVTSDTLSNPPSSTSTGRILGLVISSSDTLGVDVIAYGRWK